jgi:hypothetical protein
MTGVSQKMNAEFRMQNAELRKRASVLHALFILRSAFCILHSAVRGQK